MKNIFVLMVIFFAAISSCTKTTDTPTPLAVYNLGSGNCKDVVVSGRFVADTALTSANTVTINVDVSVPGPYSITSNTVNGISFSQTGTFTATGPQTAVLTGTGTPVATDTSDFTITPLSGPGGSCTFSVATVKGMLPPYYITCAFDGVFRNFGDSASASNSDTTGASGFAGLYVRGLDTVMNSNEKIEFGVGGAGSIGTGTYSDTSISKAYFNYMDNLGQGWSVNSSSQPSFTVTVSTITANYARGTFSGTIKDQQGMGTDSIVISNGLFSVPVK
jgi:hypothetical protein